MEHHLPENIRLLRKSGGFTQEQLAEAMGVTVGAVSKWELGQSAPDLSTLMELADFFDMSVDALLGYTLRENSAALAAERIKTMQHERRFDACLAETEKALQKYPNDFMVVYRSATAHMVMGIQCGDERALHRALALFAHARTLLSQNTDETISDVSICNDMANLQLALDRQEAALELLRKNNFDGLNDARIGMALASQCKKPDEALPYLSQALLRSVMNLGQVVMGFLNVSQKRGGMPEAADMIAWYCQLLDGLRLPDTVSPMDKFESLLLSVGACFYQDAGKSDEAKRWLRRAKQIARNFDRAPVYSVTPDTLRFYRGELRTVSDDIGQTAEQGVLALLREQDPGAAQALLAMWEEVGTNEV